MNTTRTEFGALFLDPPMRSRPAPFWFLNDSLDPERVVRQLDRLLDAGAGGVVFQARVGLPPEDYLGDKWFQAVEAVVRRAAERGAFIWLYDELGWPSGTAGGRIPGGRPWMSMVRLDLEDSARGTPDPRAGTVVAAFRVVKSDPLNGRQRRGDGGLTLMPDRILYERIMDASGDAARAGERILQFRARRVDTHPNYFDPRVTAEFIRTTHEQYYRRLAPYFGTTITHAFMDEPGVRGGTATLPWDDRFEEMFMARRGYSLVDRLPDLFFETPGHEAARFDYWSLVGERFREGFVIPVNEWCNSHGVLSSGHIEYETPLKEAIRQTGSAMPAYEHQGRVGIDILGNDFYSLRFQQEAYGSYLAIIKQASSVDRQLAKGGLMSESYGVGGHAMGPEGMQRASAFQMALGVTFFCHHAPFYSIRGERKYDCPPFIDWREPYWPHFRAHFDSVARTGWLLGQGSAVCGTLLLHPMASVHATYRLPRVDEERKSDCYLYDADLPFEAAEKHFILISSALLDAQIDHDYGDEELMARHASVEEDGVLRIGAMRYRAVVLPPASNMRASTVALLDAYVSRGGVLLAVGSAPSMVDGRPSRAAAALVEKHATRLIDGIDRFDYSEVVARLTDLGARTVTVRDAEGHDVPGMKAQRRSWEDADVLYMANVSREPARARLSIQTDRTGVVEEWDVTTGRGWSVGTCRAGEPLLMDMSWAPGEARALILREGVGEGLPRRPEKGEETGRVTPAWSGRRVEQNQLVLDPCRFRDGADYGPPVSSFQAREELARRITAAGGPVRCEIEWAFTVPAPLPAPLSCRLAVEPVDGMEIRMNGDEVSLRDAGCLLDPAIRVFPLPPCREGRNTISMRAELAQADALQAPWLLGGFRLDPREDGEFDVSAHDGSIGLGSWVTAGMPFYAGTVVYAASLEVPRGARADGTVLEMPGLLGTADVRVNGTPVGSVLWPPYACDIGGALRPGENRIEIEVANTLRNLLGPHAAPREAVTPGFGPQHYRTVAGDKKRFLDYGLTAAPEVAYHARTGRRG